MLNGHDQLGPIECLRGPLNEGDQHGRNARSDGAEEPDEGQHRRNGTDRERQWNVQLPQPQRQGRGSADEQH